MSAHQEPEIEDEDRVGQWHRVCGKVHPQNTECPVNERGPEREMVNSPAHYGGKENIHEHTKCMEAILGASPMNGFVGGLIYNCTKYLWRLGQKVPDAALSTKANVDLAEEATLEDAKKAQWYLNRLVAYLEKK